MSWCDAAILRVPLGRGGCGVEIVDCVDLCQVVNGSHLHRPMETFCLKSTGAVLIWSPHAKCQRFRGALVLDTWHYWDMGRYDCNAGLPTNLQSRVRGQSRLRKDGHRRRFAITCNCSSYRDDGFPLLRALRSSMDSEMWNTFPVLGTMFMHVSLTLDTWCAGHFALSCLAQET